jgi:hypothetical protein
VTARTLSWAGLAVAIISLACAACSGTTSGTAPSPSSAQTLTVEQVVPLLMQCFVSHDLIAASALHNGKDANPPSDSSTWIRDGKVIGNLRLGEWLRVNEGLVVKGKTVEAWILAIEANREAWPTSICGSMPAVK